MSNFPDLPTLAAFSAQLGTDFVMTEHGGIALTLSEAVPLDSRTPDERRFSLLFRGPAEGPREQAIHTLAHPALGTLAIFLVPVARDASGLQYQAIFN